MPRAFASRYPRLLSALALLPLLSAGQTASTSDAQPVELARFVVSTDKDYGYIAADTLSSGRMSTNLLMTPSDTTVLTRDFLNDLGIFNIDEASAWLTSARPLELGAVEGNSTNAGTMDVRDSGSNATLRGLTTQPSTRNYFPSATTPTEYNVERVEGARGPNAILYGEGGPGGQVNYLTKKPKTRDFGTVRARLDSFGSIGIALDVNRTLGKQAAFRYNGNWFDGQGWQDRVKNNLVGNALAVMYHPFAATTVSVDVDTTRTYRSGIINEYIDTQSNWNRVPLTGPVTLTAAQAAAAGLTTLGTGLARYRVYTEGLGIVDWRGYAQTVGNNVPVIPDVDRGIPRTPAIPSREFNTNPSQVNVRGRTTDVQAAIEHTFGNGLVVEVAGAYGRINQDGASVRYDTAYLDPNLKLPDGRDNPNFGKTYSSTFYGRNIDGSSRDLKALRLAGNYPIPLWGGVQNVSVIGQHLEQDTHTLLSMQRIVDNPSAANPITNNANLVYVFRYWDTLPAELPNLANMFQLRNVPEQDSSTRRRNDSIQLGTYGSYLHNQLSIVGGFRRDKSNLSTSDGTLATRDPITGQIGAYTVSNRLAYNNSLSGGAVYFPFQNVGPYVDYSDGFTIQTNANPRIDGSFTEVNIVPSSAKSAGLRFKFLGGKVVGSVGYYHAKESNSLLTVGAKAINTLWRNHPGNDAKIINTFTSAENITDTQSREGFGWEGEVTASISNSLRMTANLAFPRTKQSDVGAGFRSYVDANLAQWESWAGDPTNPTQANDLLNLNNTKQAVQSFQDGRAQNQTYRWRFNLFGNYIVRQTALKGLRIGLGGQFFGPRLIGNQNGLPYDYVYDKTYYLLTGSLGYPVRFRKTTVDFQVNIMNLLDYDKPLYNGVLLYNGALIPYAYKYSQPRAVRLTATYGF